MQKRRLLALALIVGLMMISFTACQKEEPEPSPEVVETPTPTPEPTPEPEPEETEYTGPRNPLTGEPVDEDISANRPYAIMINNLQAALPQVGVSQADIIYELPVEGGITRMLAVFQDITGVGEIGTVRSSRPYYLDIAQGHDAIYVHAGGSDEAYSQIWSRGINNIDGVNGSGNEFYRDSARSQSAGYEHSMLTTSDLLQQYIGNYGYRLEHEAGYGYTQAFTDGAVPDGEKADEVTVVFSTYKTGVFTYDEDTGLYMISQYGGAYVDGATDEQVGVTNVLVLNSSFAVVDSVGRLSADLNSSGDGYYICGGKYVPINWSKDSATSAFKYTLTDGTPLEMGTGKVYVNIIGTDGDVTFR